MHHVAVIDIGKTNVKLAVVDADLREEIDILTTPNNTIQNSPYPHFDIPAVWKFVLDGLTQFAKTYDLKAITATTHGACAVLLDKQGELATPVLDYEHDGPDDCKQDYEKIRPPFSQTGSPLLAGGLNVGAQIYWLFQQQPGLKNKVHTILMYPQYWTYRLCGVLANEPTSLGSHTDLWNPTARGYSDLVDTLAITPKMAETTLPSTIQGVVTPDIASATGLAEDTPVYCGIHDSNASLVPHLKNLQAPFSVVSTGTWVVCMSPGGTTTGLDELRDTLLNVSAFGEPVPSGKFMGGREYDYLSQTYGAVETPQVTDQVLNKGAFILPSVEPSSGPYQNSKYQWTLDPAQLSPEERYNVISFYLALMTHTCLTLCNSNGPIIIEGPFTNNLPYCAMLSASTGRTVSSNVRGSTGTSIGAAILTHPASATLADQYRILAEEIDLAALKTYSKEWQKRTRLHC